MKYSYVKKRKRKKYRDWISKLFRHGLCAEFSVCARRGKCSTVVIVV